MTFRQKLKELCFQNGMFENQADAVVSRYAENAKASDFIDQDTEGYPDEMIVVAWLGVKGEAVNWIDENLPKAWFRPMFAGK